MKDSSDNEILAFLQNETQFEKGFRLLMTKYQERLYWQVRRMVEEHEDANDVIQNVFIKVYRNIHRFEGKSKLYTWLYRIATNETLTFLKKRKKRAFAAIDSEDFDIKNQLKADTYLDGEELQERLKYVMGQLPDKQRLVFNLRYYDELSYKEMSEILETSEGALKASYHHAAKKIEAFFKA